MQTDGLRELALFAGAGGGILGGKLLGWKTVCAVEIEDYARRVLMARQNDGHLDPFPIWDDVRTFDGTQWRGVVDIITGGFPCQDISSAGRGAGINGARSGLWSHFKRIIGEVRPRYVLVENSPMLTSRGLGRVLGDLASLGYDAKWGGLGADSVGAPHKRLRIWIVAHANSERELQSQGSIGNVWRWTGNGCKKVSDSNRAQCERGELSSRAHSEHSIISDTCWWSTEPGVGRMANGVANRMDRLKAIGNGQVSGVVRLAWETLKP